MCEELPGRLRARPVRVGAPFAPVPFSQEKRYLPAAPDVVRAVQATLAA